MKKRFSSIYLLIAFILIASLTWLKSQNTLPSEEFSESSSFYRTSPLPAHQSLELFLPERVVYIAQSPISNRQFQSFVLATGYQSWRERHMRWPNWRYPKVHAISPTQKHLNRQKPLSPEDPVLWLTQRDAEEYCKWVAELQGDLSPYDQMEKEKIWRYTGCRLPTCEELDALQKTTSIESHHYWEWTANTLRDYKANLFHASQYLTAWKPGGKKRHRRVVDLGDKEEELTVFRVSWTVEMKEDLSH